MSPVGPLEPSQTGFLMTKRPRMASKTASKLCLRPIPESAWKNGNFDPHKFIPQYSFDWSSLPDMKYTLTAHLPKAISGRNGKTPLRSQLKSISGTPMSNLSRFPAKNITVQALFIFGVPKWGSGPPRGDILNKVSIFFGSSSWSMYRGPTMRIWAFSANYSCLQGICCHFWPNLSPGAALGYLRNGALDRKTFLVKVGSYEVYKTHIEFGEVWWFSLAEIGCL